MAKAKFIPILTVATGLNNTLDPSRLKFVKKTGETELSQAVNVDIDNSGRINRRRGRVLKNAISSRCGFAHGEVCLFVSGTTLQQLWPDYTATVIRSGLTNGARMHYVAVAGRIYYTNGFEKGYVFNGMHHDWIKGDYAAPGATRRTFSNPPLGHLLGWFAGRLLVAKDNAVFASEPSFYGVFDLHNNFKLAPDKITMLQPTPQGLWIGTTAQVLFYRGTQWEQLRREPKAEFGVLEGSDAWAPAEKMVGAASVVFTTPQGICAGSEDGTLTNLTFNKLTFPAGQYANAVVAGDRYLTLIEP